MFGRKKPEVVVVGAGPVGLFAALTLAHRGVHVQIVDKEWRPSAHSYALALHPHALSLLEELGVVGTILQRAYRVQSVGLYDGGNRRAELRLSDLTEDYPFVAVMRQDVLEGVLEEALRKHGVRVQWNHEVSRLEPGADAVAVTIDKMEKESVGYAAAHMEWFVAKTWDLDVPFVIGADGHRSGVRRSLGLDFPLIGEAQHFAVFEFRTDADLGPEMRIVMDEASTNVLWPLPEGRCRWSFQLSDYEAPPATRSKDNPLVNFGGGRFPVLTEDHLHDFIAERAPWFTGSVEQMDWRLVVRFETRLTESFGQGRVWLAGDAGHMTGPVGIQSMNVGLREAYDLAGRIAGVLRDGASPDQLADYGQERLHEWRALLGLEGGLKAGADTDPWIQARVDRLLPCIPASGDNLVTLARQLGLDAWMGVEV